MTGDFGWILLAVFAFWVFRMVGAGTRQGERGAPGRPLPPRAGRPQREGTQLEQLLRQLDQRLRSGPRPASRVAQPPVANPAYEGRLVPRTDRAATARAPEPRRVAAQMEQPAPPAEPKFRGLTASGLREVVVWREILGPPRAFSE